jgi:hypothetical protein
MVLPRLISRRSRLSCAPHPVGRRRLYGRTIRPQPRRLIRSTAHQAPVQYTQELDQQQRNHRIPEYGTGDAQLLAPGKEDHDGEE